MAMHSRAARVYFARQVDQAIAQYLKTLEIDENFVPAHLVLGQAVIYAGLADTNRTLAWLEKGYQERSTWMVWLKVDPRFDSMRSDPRFQSLLRRLGLCC